MKKLRDDSVEKLAVKGWEEFRFWQGPVSSFSFFMRKDK